MKKYLLAFCFTVICASCTKPSPSPNPVVVVGCAVEQALTGAFAASLSAAFSCSGISQMQSDIQAMLGKVDLCAKVPKPDPAGHKKGVVGGIICPLAVQAVMGAVGSKIPATWGCSAGSSASADALTVACNSAVPY